MEARGEEESGSSVSEGGERMVPESASEPQFWEHLYRYLFAAAFVEDRTVLDVACGEGYGAYILDASGARKVVGVDESTVACKHAAERYGIDTASGRAQDLPVEDDCVDVVVSLETVAHMPREAQEAFMAECARVARPGGTVVVSTPNRDVWELIGPSRPNHVRDLSRSGLVQLLTSRFVLKQLFGQRVHQAAVYRPESLFARRSFWSRVPGTYRLTRLLRRKISPHLFGDAIDIYRSDPEEALEIRSSVRSGWTRWIDPYAIRPVGMESRIEPQYFVAVAEVE